MGKHVEIPVGAKVKFNFGFSRSEGTTVSGRVKDERGDWGYHVKPLSSIGVINKVFCYTKYVKVVK